MLYIDALYYTCNTIHIASVTHYEGWITMHTLQWMVHCTVCTCAIDMCIGVTLKQLFSQ